MPARRTVEGMDPASHGSGVTCEACSLARLCEGILERRLGLATTRLFRLTCVTYSSLREPPGERVRIPGAPPHEGVAA